MNISGPAAVAKPEMLFYAPGDLTVTNYQCDLLKLSDITPIPDGFRGSPIMLCFDYQAQTVQGIVGPSIEVRPVESVIYYGQKKTENSS